MHKDTETTLDLVIRVKVSSNGQWNPMCNPILIETLRDMDVVDILGSLTTFEVLGEGEDNG